MPAQRRRDDAGAVPTGRYGLETLLLIMTNSGVTGGRQQPERARRERPPYLYVKRVLDLMLAVFLLVPSLMIIAVCFLAIKLETPGPAFYVQCGRG